MTEYQESLDRQKEVDEQIKLLGTAKYEKGRDRTTKERGFGETNAGKMLANQALKGFIEQLDSNIIAQPRLTRSVIVKLLTKNHKKFDEDEIDYVLDPAIIGRLVIRCVLRSIMRPGDRRITVTGVGFAIGLTVEQAIKEVLIDIDYKKKKAGKMDMLRRQGKLGDDSEILRVMEQLAEEVDIDHKDWTEKQRGSLGMALLEHLYASKVYRSSIQEDYDRVEATLDLEEDNA